MKTGPGRVERGNGLFANVSLSKPSSQVDLGCACLPGSGRGNVLEILQGGRLMMVVLGFLFLALGNRQVGGETEVDDVEGDGEIAPVHVGK